MHSAIGCNSQRDLVCIGAIPLKNFRSRDYEIMRRQDLVRELVRSEDPQSWNIPDVGNELSSNCSSKERRPKPKNFLWKRVPLPEESKSASKIEHGWRLFLKSFHSPIPHTPVLIIIWWNGKKTYIICPLINALHWFNGHVIKLVLPFHQYVTHVYFWSNYGINWLVISFNIASM